MTSAVRLRGLVPDSDRAHAVRVAAGLVIPGLVLVALDRPGLIIYAVFGSFTGMYGRTDSRVMRLLHQSQGALLLLCGTAVGILLAHEHAGSATVIAAAAPFSVVGSLVADFFALRGGSPRAARRSRSASVCPGVMSTRSRLGRSPRRSGDSAYAPGPPRSSTRSGTPSR